MTGSRRTVGTGCDGEGAALTRTALLAAARAQLRHAIVARDEATIDAASALYEAALAATEAEIVAEAERWGRTLRERAERLPCWGEA